MTAHTQIETFSDRLKARLSTPATVLLMTGLVIAVIGLTWSPRHIPFALAGIGLMFIANVFIEAFMGIRDLRRQVVELRARIIVLEGTPGAGGEVGPAQAE